MDKKILESLPKVDDVEWVMREMWVWNNNVEEVYCKFVTHRWIDGEEYPFVTLTGAMWKNASDTDPRNAIKAGDLVVRFEMGKAVQFDVAHHKQFDGEWVSGKGYLLGHENPGHDRRAVKASPELVAAMEAMLNRLEEEV